MMRRLTIVLLLLDLCGCGGARMQLGEGLVKAIAVYGSQASDFSFDQTSDSVTIAFETVPQRGTFISLDLPEGKALGEEQWRNDDGTLHLYASNNEVHELGIVPTADYDGQVVTATFRLVNSRTVSEAPAGPKNNIFDLSIVPAGQGQVRLSWTEVNIGDYDFNGTVNIADLTPLGPNINREVYGGSEERLWWIDGDRNKQINIADLTPLGSAFNLEVGGFIIKRNGVRIDPLTAPFTVDAALGQSRQPNLPRLHTFVADGSTSDTWLVQTVDRFGDDGADNNGGQSGPDVTLRVDVAGLNLLSVNKSASQAALDAGESIMRIILPGDDVDGIEWPGLGERNYLAGGGAGISGLPRGVPLCADIIYIPAADLATGATRSASSAHGYPQEYYVYTRVPFILPQGDSTLLIDAQIELTPNSADGGYYVELTARHTQGGATTTRRSRLNYALGALQVDSDGNGDFADEPRLDDGWRTNVSDALRARYAAESTYATRTESVVEGTITAIDQAAGTLTLGSAREQVLGGGWSTPAQFTVNFSELTGFDQRTVGAGSSDIDFTDLAVDDKLEVAVTRLSDSSQSTLHLADNVTRVVGEPDLDTVYAVPEIQLAYPGQPVRVTVSTSATAKAFKSLHSLQITYPASCRYQPGSFNAGKFVKGDEELDPWKVDGIWSAVGATGFNVPDSDFAEFIEGNRRALRVQIRPTDGSEVPSASGDLFSFVLIAGGDCDLAFTRGSGIQLTAYADGNPTVHFWTKDDNAGQPTIRVSGERPVLSILNPPPGTDGSAGNPFQITAPADYQLALYSGGANVTTAPGTHFSVAPASGGSVDANGLLHIAAGFEGLLTVSASYNNLPNTSNSTLYFNSGPPEFMALVDRAATFANGGIDAGTFQTVMTDLGDRVEVRVLGSGLLDLRALHFTLPFDHTQYRYAGYSGLEVLDVADTRDLILPAAGGPEPVLIGGDATLRFGLAMAQPSKFTGGDSLVTLHFDRVPPAAEPSYPARTYVPPQFAPILGNGEDAGVITWKYLNPGDTDENGSVEYRDYNLIAKLYGKVGAPPFVEDQLEDIVDCNDDGQIGELDALVVEANLDTAVEAYRIYGSDDPSDYSNGGGAQVTTILWSQREPNGDDRTFFVFDTGSESPQYENYWIVPIVGAQEGAKSNLLPVP